MKYKSFREQYLECCKNGNLVEIEFRYPTIICKGLGKNGKFQGLVCKKFMKQCMSNVCEKERGVIEERKRRKKEVENE